MQGTKRIVFDIDDVLWSLNKRICDKHNIDIKKIKNFKISLNKELTENEVNTLFTEYGNPDIFKNIIWNDGIERVNELNKLVNSEYNKYEVVIHSNSFSKDIADLKISQLIQVLDITDKQLFMNYNGKTKQDLENTFIVVDDSPYNILNSKAEHKIMLGNTWNTSDEASKLLSGVEVVILPTLSDIVDYIERIIGV